MDQDQAKAKATLFDHAAKKALGPLLEKGRFISINSMCRRQGLMLGFRAIPHAEPAWSDKLHCFFVLQEKPK
jgi:hypothetical protein